MKIGVLVIGSLLWDKKDKREVWRRKRLKIKNKIHVKVPIRYGRISNGGTYTMTFSKELNSINKLGTSFIIPIINPSIKSTKGIEFYARRLSEAEKENDSRLCKGNKEKWCTIGLLFNPNFNEEKKIIILNWWKKLVNNDGGLEDYKEYKVGQENSILSDKGEILLGWLQSVDKNNQPEINNYDVILATCTKPNCNIYPNVKQIRKRIRTDTRKYFYNNIINGITTFQDREIISY